MNTPVPPLIPSDSQYSTFKNSLLNTFSLLNLPKYESSDDVIDPPIGILIYNTTDNSLQVYNGSSWLTISSGTDIVFTQQGSKLVGTGVVGNAFQGISVSLSSDGNTIAVGGRLDNTSVGAVWIFTRTDGVLTQQGSKLIGTGGIGFQQQGSSVSISADGDTLAIGGQLDNGNMGATWIFTRTAGVWTQQGSKLVGTGAVGNPRQGTSVALSEDGNTLAVGGEIDDNSYGATWVFTRSAGVWTQQGSKLVGTGGSGLYISQGSSVSLSSDGNTLAIGARYDDDGDTTWIGATWVFTRSAGVWTQQGSKLVGTGYIGTEVEQGLSVALSGDGNTLAVGGYSDGLTVTGEIGATWIFTRSAGVWTQQGSKLVGTGAVGFAGQGRGVSLSSDGNILAVGGSIDDGGIGAIWIFTRSGGGWSQLDSKLVGTGNIGNSGQGTSVALSSDGTTLAGGGRTDNGSIGATWIFTS